MTGLKLESVMYVTLTVLLNVCSKHANLKLNESLSLDMALKVKVALHMD